MILQARSAFIYVALIIIIMFFFFGGGYAHKYNYLFQVQ